MNKGRERGLERNMSWWDMATLVEPGRSKVRVRPCGFALSKANLVDRHVTVPYMKLKPAPKRGNGRFVSVIKAISSSEIASLGNVNVAVSVRSLSELRPRLTR
ncbi:2442_t:CDS:1 [Acaulospora colombiana]|uniref:2442_t:CDS:1 n=1 Tax=Acaulospora colombiana TaxID=27376 RepID=A0ACA9KQF7_9GLOM|nr:2442_t:CDS:1 [Acaulospora colombiana]